jgi:hypothetical protein
VSQDYCDVDLGQYSEDSDPVTCLIERDVSAARKATKCTECGESIPVGAPYHRISYRFEGAFHRERLCAACLEVKREFGHQMLGGFLWEFMGEEWDNGANVQGCINRLATVAAKMLMHRQWLEWKGIDEPRAVDAVREDSR